MVSPSWQACLSGEFGHVAGHPAARSQAAPRAVLWSPCRESRCALPAQLVMPGHLARMPGALACGGRTDDGCMRQPSRPLTGLRARRVLTERSQQGLHFTHFHAGVPVGHPRRELLPQERGEVSRAGRTKGDISFIHILPGRHALKANNGRLGLFEQPIPIVLPRAQVGADLLREPRGAARGELPALPAPRPRTGAVGGPGRHRWRPSSAGFLRRQRRGNLRADDERLDRFRRHV